MNEEFARKVLEILADSMNWNDAVVLEIAKLAKTMGLATGVDEGDFEIVQG